jgi:hypothetical protein
MGDELTWVPQACALPSVEQPLRVAEFDELFATALRELLRPTATSLRLVLDPSAARTARELTERETACCSFFTFTITDVGDELHVEVGVPPVHLAVLDALADRADAARRAAA